MIIVAGSKFMGSWNSFLWVSCGLSFSGSIQEESSADFLSFLRLDWKPGNIRAYTKYLPLRLIAFPVINPFIIIDSCVHNFCRFYFDFSMTYIGAGMICSHLVNLSLLFGAVLSWGLMWPLISGLKGDWFPSTISESSMKSLNGYKVCQ